MEKYKIFVVNPGSTSTKIALFEGEECVFSQNIAHDAKKLSEFNKISEQLPYRMKIINDFLASKNIDLSGTDAFVGRGGSVCPLESGVYEIDELLLNDSINAAGGVQHPANLGVQIADALKNEFGGKGYTVNPPQVDEFCDLARVTGIKGIYRASHLHALNLKETAIRHAKKYGKNYEDCNFVVCHIGGGISVSAHQKGKMIDGNDTAGGDGPIAPTRSGSIAVSDLIRFIDKNGTAEAKLAANKSGGFVSWLGTSDAREVTRMAEDGNKEAKLVWDAMIYQICKYIGSMAAALNGRVDGILLGGGMVHSEDLVAKIKGACAWIAPVYAYPGEFEMEALAAGAVRALSGEEKVKKYSGKPVWNGFEF